MTLDLRFQGPVSDAPTLLETLAAAAKPAVGGIAVFSFASHGGVRLLFSDPDFSQFLDRGYFRLVVGVDAVTTPDALALLQDEAKSRQRLKVSAFVHDRRAALFHPKAAWFYGDRAGRAVIGSGNLTRGGLLNNWEAFAYAKVKPKGVARLHSQWASWLRANRRHLHGVTDPVVVARAQANQSDNRVQHEEEAVEAEDDLAETTHGDESVLLAEIPRAAGRWRQANFDIGTYTGFFGLLPGTTRRVVLVPVRPDGSLGAREVRPGVSVKSQNYRIELGQGVGLSYPDEGRPIGVFRRVGTRRFRYRLVMPGGIGYDDAHAILAQDTSGIGTSRMKRLVIPYVEFRRRIGTSFSI